MITNKIENLRTIKKISQTDFAKKIGMTQTGYSQMIKNNDLKVSTLQKIAEILEKPVSYFFDEKEQYTSDYSGNKLIATGNGKNHVEINNSLKECEKENEYLKKEIEHLKNKIIDKEEIINLLKNK